MQKRFYMKERSGRHQNLVILFFFVILLFFFIGLIGLYIIGSYSRQGSKKTPKSFPTPTGSLEGLSPFFASPTAKLRLDPSISINRTLRVSVLNGSGVAGAASDISNYLSSLGYTIVSVGNANNYVYRNITVLVKTKKSSYAQLLKKDLQDHGASVSAGLSDDISVDAEVIVGK